MHYIKDDRVRHRVICTHEVRGVSSQEHQSYFDEPSTCSSVDAAFKDTELSDFVAIGVLVLIGRHVYLWHLTNKRMSFIETVAKIKEIHREFPDIDEFVIEDKANGSAIIDVFRYEEGIPPYCPCKSSGR